jgi:hypothetical protein
MRKISHALAMFGLITGSISFTRLVFDIFSYKTSVIIQRLFAFWNTYFLNPLRFVFELFQVDLSLTVANAILFYAIVGSITMKATRDAMHMDEIFRKQRMLIDTSFAANFEMRKEQNWVKYVLLPKLMRGLIAIYAALLWPISFIEMLYIVIVRKLSLSPMSSLIIMYSVISWVFYAVVFLILFSINYLYLD